jgi:hypothetical protein
MSTRLGVDAANSAADAVAGRLNNGYARVYSGSPPTGSADGAITTQVLLAEAPLAATAFGAASGGQIIANAITTVSCIASGTAGWFRTVRSNGATVEFDGTAGTANAEMILSSVDLVQNQDLEITSLTFRFPLS